MWTAVLLTGLFSVWMQKFQFSSGAAVSVSLCCYPLGTCTLPACLPPSLPALLHIHPPPPPKFISMLKEMLSTCFFIGVCFIPKRNQMSGQELITILLWEVCSENQLDRNGPWLQLKSIRALEIIKRVLEPGGAVNSQVGLISVLCWSVLISVTDKAFSWFCSYAW